MGLRERSLLMWGSLMNFTFSMSQSHRHNGEITLRVASLSRREDWSLGAGALYAGVVDAHGRRSELLGT